MSRALRLVPLAALIALAGPALAQKKKVEEPPPVETVRYSYEKWSRAEPARYLLVPTPTSVAQGDLADRTRSLFKALVGAKRGSYGDARLAFQDDYAKTGHVYVWLDMSKAPYHPIVMAETTYTFTENGATRVIFPKKAPEGWTRADVPFSAYVLSVPLWQVLPPDGLTGALAQLPDGTLTTAEAALDKLAKGDREMQAAVWSYASQAGAPALAVVRAAPLVKIPALDDKLIPLLESGDPALRTAALSGLEGLDDKKVNTALRQVMDNDPEPRLRDVAAGMLAKSKDEKFATAAQYHALRSSDPAIVKAAAEGLGKSKQKEATDQLLGVLGHQSDAVRAAVIAALIERGDQKALVARLDDTKLDGGIRLEAARALAAGKDATARHAALMHLAVEGRGDDAVQAATALAEFDKKETYAALGKALRHPEGAARVAAAGALGKLGKPAGLEPLAAADVADAESGVAVRKAIRDIYAGQPIDAVLKATRESNPILRREAVATLGVMVETGAGKKSRKTIVETLRPLSEVDDPEIRAASARSFGEMGGDDVRPDVLRLAADKAVEVQRAVAHALRAFPGPESVKFLLGYMQQKDPVVLAHATESLGLLKEREALNPVIAQLNHDDVRVRRAATGALIEIGGTLDQRGPLLSFFSERLFDQDGQVRLKAVEGLRLVKDPRTVTAMAALIQDPVPEVRRATLMAMADTGDVSAVDAIAGALDNDDVATRRAAIDALAQLKKKEAVPVLEAYAGREKNEELAGRAKKVIGDLKGG